MSNFYNVIVKSKNANNEYIYIHYNVIICYNIHIQVIFYCFYTVLWLRSYEKYQQKTPYFM